MAACRLAWALAVWWALWLPAAPATAQPRPFADALTAEDSGLGRFPAETAQRVVSLPDDWSQTRPRENDPAVVPAAL